MVAPKVARWAAITPNAVVTADIASLAADALVIPELATALSDPPVAIEFTLIVIAVSPAFAPTW